MISESITPASAVTLTVAAQFSMQPLGSGYSRLRRSLKRAFAGYGQQQRFHLTFYSVSDGQECSGHPSRRYRGCTQGQKEGMTFLNVLLLATLTTETLLCQAAVQRKGDLAPNLETIGSPYLESLS